MNATEPNLFSLPRVVYDDGLFLLLPYGPHALLSRYVVHPLPASVSSGIWRQWQVQKEDTEDTYRTGCRTDGRWFCDCKDARFRRKPGLCKHAAGLRALLQALGFGDSPPGAA
jgi:hypothetical protein